MECQKLKFLIFLVGLSSLCMTWTDAMDHICVSIGHNELLFPNNSLFDDANTESTVYCENLRLSVSTNGYSSIGGAKFQLRQNHEIMMGYQHEPGFVGGGRDKCLRFVNSDSGLLNKIQVQAVKVRGTNRYLQGWLSFDVTLGRFTHWAFFQVSDELGNAIGEFVSDGEKVCDDVTAIFPRPQQYLPCSAAGLQEPRVSQAVVYVANEFLRNKPIGAEKFLPPQNGDGETPLRLRFLWKLDEYYCNRHEKFRFIIFHHYGLNSKDEYSEATLRKSNWLRPNWFGVADVIPTNTDFKAECGSDLSTAMTEDKNYWINGNDAPVDGLNERGKW